MTDWTWEYADPESRKDLAARYCLERVDLRSFQDAMARSSRALNACQEIANGSKHREVRRRRADLHVRVTAAWAELKQDRSGARRFGTAWLIVDRIGTRPALEVFRETADYWCGVLAPFMEHRFIAGSGTRRPVRRREPA